MIEDEMSSLKISKELPDSQNVKIKTSVIKLQEKLQGFRYVYFSIILDFNKNNCNKLRRK